MPVKVTWLGQAGLYIQLAGVNILIDPYLSDSVGKKDPTKTRRVPADPSFFDITPDVLAFTHDHEDHYDEETAARYLAQKRAFTVLAPGECWKKARAHGGGHNYVLFNTDTQWTQGNVRFTAVAAVHSDPAAIGILVEGEGKTLYITGDTLYSKKLLEHLPEKIDVIFLPINGTGNNMNMTDAARLVGDTGATIAIPLHVGMMDDLDPRDFPCENKQILTVYQQTLLGGSL